MRDLKKTCVVVGDIKNFQLVREFFALATRLGINRSAERFERACYLGIYDNTVCSMSDSEGREIIEMPNFDTIADTPKRKELLALAKFRTSNPDGDI